MPPSHEKEYRRRYYLKNKEKFKVSNDRKVRESKLLIREAKKVPCADCGVEYPPHVMDFDHRDPSQKDGLVSKMLTRTKLLAEIAKCDVVCANCHRERVFKAKQYTKQRKEVMPCSIP